MVEAGDLCVWAQRQRWNKTSMRDCRLGVPSMGSGAGGKPAFMSARVVSERVDMLVRWGGCHRGNYYLLILENCQENSLREIQLNNVL